MGKNYCAEDIHKMQRRGSEDFMVSETWTVEMARFGRGNGGTGMGGKEGGLVLSSSLCLFCRQHSWAPSGVREKHEAQRKCWEMPRLRRFFVVFVW